MNLSEPLIVSNDRQLFVDNHLIDNFENVLIHQPAPHPARNVSHAQSPLGR